MAGLTDAERAAWDADGVFVVRDLFPAPQLAALQSEASRLISAELPRCLRLLTPRHSRQVHSSDLGAEPKAPAQQRRQLQLHVSVWGGRPAAWAPWRAPSSSSRPPASNVTGEGDVSKINDVVTK